MLALPIAKKFSSIIITLFISVLILTGCYTADPMIQGAGKNDAAMPAGTPDLANTELANATFETTGTTVPKNWRNYENEYFGIRFSYPSDIFQLSDAGESIVLKSDFTVTDDEFGKVSEDLSATYSMKFDLSSRDVVTTSEQLLPIEAGKMFPDGTTASFRTHDGMSVTKIDGVDSYAYNVVEDGIRRCRYLIPRSSSETIILTYEFGTSERLTDRTQEEIFQVITKSIDLF